MLTGKRVSSKEIISKFYRDTAYDDFINQDDCIDWIYDCLGLLAMRTYFDVKIAGPDNSTEPSPYNFTDYKVPLPCDFYRLRYVLVDGCPARYTSSEYIHLLSSDCCLQTSATQWSILGTEAIHIDGFNNAFSSFAGTQIHNNCNTEFTINDNYIFFNQQQGKACIIYEAYPIDKDGFPLIPDDIKVKQALSDYIRAKLDYISWRKGDITKEMFDYSERESMWSLPAAKNREAMPDELQMDHLQKMLLKIKPNLNSWKSLFADSNH